MQIIDINQALPQIMELLEKAATGEEIVITKNDRPMVKLSSTQPLVKRSPLFGSERLFIK